MNQYTITPIMGLDIGKNMHVFAAYASDDLRRLVEPIEIRNNREGFDRLTRCIRKLLKQYGQAQVGNEPTGIYYEAFGREIQTHFADELAAGRLSYQLVNPHQVKLARTALQNGRQRKSDAIDTQAIARCLQQGLGFEPRLSSGDSLLFEQWANRYRRNERSKRELGNSIINQMDRLWPGALVNVKRFKRAHPHLPVPDPLVQTRPLERKLVQAILTHSPNPHDILSFTEDEMIAFLRQYVGRGGVNTARKVLRNARQALLPPDAVARVYAASLSQDWDDYQRLLEREHTLIQQATSLVPNSTAAVLLDVPGISPYHAARYLAAIGEVERFPSAGHIWSYAGFDPTFTQSGDTRRDGNISKRGDPAFRDALYLIGQSTAHHCPPIGAAFHRCYRRDPRRRVLATLHAAHKANRLIYALLGSQQAYDPLRHH